LDQDERETHLPGQLLIELGRQSWEHLRNLAPIGESVSILTESNDPLDPYGRTLAYVFLSDGTCLNEKMIEDGFAKPYDRFFCSKLPDYQVLSNQARIASRGLFSRVNNFWFLFTPILFLRLKIKGNSISVVWKWPFCTCLPRFKMFTLCLPRKEKSPVNFSFTGL